MNCHFEGGWFLFVVRGPPARTYAHFSKIETKIVWRPRITWLASVCKKSTFSPHWQKTHHTRHTIDELGGFDGVQDRC